ncbi:nucleoid occlusion protein [Lentibacillus saliphilus]|uniref:nucleoid occlusion protein n=1 Tax=Lentibacillus saliphilus TaxID=2737028 RepID=UPI001C2F12CB|nr:nucleoid occlusion protein [Lentibacillus saliphilus]
MFNRIFNTGDKQETDENLIQSDEVIEIPVTDIQANRFQPRAIFNEEKIQELSQTIHTHGMIQPIVVRKTDEDGYEIIAGERRWRAVQMLGWDNIPAIVREMTDTETASVALIENLQREELTVIEEAKAYAQLLELHALTQEALAQRLGKSQSTIANKLRLLKLPLDVQTAILNKEITERHARALIKLGEEEKQSAVLKVIKDKQLNVKETEAYIANLQHKDEKKPKKRPKLKGINKDIRIAMNTIRQSLNMVSDTGVDVESNEEDLEDYYQITIRIPKKK